MPAWNDIKRSSIQEQIFEINRKIQLLEGNKKAYLEKVNWTVEKNTKFILEMREENKKLHRILNQTLTDDSYVIDKGFETHYTEKPLFLVISAQATQYAEEKLLATKKTLNSLRGITHSSKYQLDELKTIHNKRVQQYNDRLKAEKAAKQVIRQLENRLDKAKLKAREAVHIQKIYVKLLDGLYTEAREYEGRLLVQQASYKDVQNELHKIQIMYGDAQISRDWMKEDVVNRETNIFKKRIEHEEALNDIRVKEEQEKDWYETLEKRLKRLLLHENLMFEELKKPRLSVELREKKLAGLENTFSVVNAVLGISSPQHMVAIFKKQEQTKKHLRRVYKSNFLKIQQMEKKKAQLQEECDQLIYESKNDPSKWKATVDAYHKDINIQTDKKNEMMDKLVYNQRFLTKVKIALLHLVDIVKYLDGGKFSVVTENIATQHILLLKHFEDRILLLQGKLKDKEKEGILVHVKEDGYFTMLEQLFPLSNMRVLPPPPRKSLGYDAHDRKHEDAVFAPSRADMKTKSLKLIEFNMKRRHRPVTVDRAHYK